MKSKPTYKWLFLIPIFLTALGLFLNSSVAANAANRVYHYKSINVDIKILENSDIVIRLGLLNQHKL